MAILIYTGSTPIFSDRTEPYKGSDAEPDGATRRMTLQVASEEAALDHVDVGEAHPNHANLLCAGGRVTRVIRCGMLYEVEFTYLGLLASKSPVIKTKENIEGWDTATKTQFVFASSAEAATSGEDLGDSLSGSFPHMICIDRFAEDLIEGFFYKVTFSYKGILNGGKPVKWIPRGYSEKQSASAGIYTGQATPVPLESNQALVGVTAVYLSTTVPSLDVAGTNVTPSWSPGVPSNIWSSIANPIHVYPYGWVLETREPDIIPGTTICLVTDQYVYYQRYKPGQ